jgi:hypothetical protein
MGSWGSNHLLSQADVVAQYDVDINQLDPTVGYNGNRALHTQMDQPWKDAVQNRRRQGRTTASAQEIYEATADTIQRSPQRSPGVKETMQRRLHDEMFIEYGLQRGQQMTLPYPNIRPRP